MYSLKEFFCIYKYESFLSFDIFNIQRLDEQDIYLRGEPVYESLVQITNLIAKHPSDRFKVLQHKLDRLTTMCHSASDPNNIVMTKFMSRNWRKYITISNYSENFVPLYLYLGIKPELWKEDHLTFLAQRVYDHFDTKRICDQLNNERIA